MIKNSNDKIKWHDLLDSWRINFSKINTSTMKIPIIGDRNEKAAQEYQQKQAEKFQNEMSLKLIDWQIENKCSVTALLRTISSPTQAGHTSMIVFLKLEDKQIKELEGLKEKFIQELEENDKSKN